MSLILSVPGKTFFAGEYVALNGGPAILVCTAPRFELKVRAGSGWTSGIHKDSPAGKLIQKHPVFFNQFDIEFIDPHFGRGGWGASTAQFLMTYALLQWQDAVLVEAEKYFDTHKLLNAYKEVSWSGQGLPPSGADLVGQWKGGFTFFEKKRGLISYLRWPFSDLEFFLIPTGHKIPTHEHISQLASLDTTELEAHMHQIHEAFTTENKAALVEGIFNYNKSLQDKDWVHPETLKLLKEFQSIPGVLAAKGCGALGADVVLVLVEKDKSVLFEALLKNQGRAYFSRHHVSNGLSLFIEGDFKIEKYTGDMSL